MNWDWEKLQEKRQRQQSWRPAGRPEHEEDDGRRDESHEQDGRRKEDDSSAGFRFLKGAETAVQEAAPGRAATPDALSLLFPHPG